jgi:hypothetical protein
LRLGSVVVTLPPRVDWRRGGGFETLGGNGTSVRRICDRSMGEASFAVGVVAATDDLFRLGGIVER